MKQFNEKVQKELEALETLIVELKELGWVRSPDTKENFAPYYIRFEKDEQRIIITWSEFVLFETDSVSIGLTVSGYVLIAITKYLQAVKL